MKRMSLAVVLAFLATGCSSSPAPAPAVVNPTFTAQLLPANETPPITTGGESAASGNVTITFVTTKDAAGNVTSAVGTAVVNLQGFPSDSSITLAHIHTGAAGVKGAVLENFIPASTVPLTNGAGSFTQVNTTIAGSDATNIMNNPAGFYFNVHTQANPGGVIRGQLVRTQ
jgi:hypothetical protein